MSSGLYDDLADPIAEASALRRELEEARRKLQIADERVQDLQRLVEARDEEVATLKKNVSAIYHTAKREIERKEAQLRPGPSS
jgi:Tfp pilus assembly protein PilW